MPTNILLLPLIGGYALLHLFYYTRLRSQMLDGYRLLVESAAAGLILAVIAWFAAKELSTIPWVSQTWIEAAPRGMDFFGTGLLSVVLGVSLPMITNWLLDITGVLTWKVAQSKAIQRHGSHLLRLLHEAQNLEVPVSITLDNKKVYIGFVIGPPNLRPQDCFVRIIPLYSGFRDDQLTLTLTVSYLKVYEDRSPGDFALVLPLDSVCSAGFFDHSVFHKFVIEQTGINLDALTVENQQSEPNRETTANSEAHDSLLPEIKVTNVGNHEPEHE